MARPKQKKGKMASKITAKTALESALILMCRMPIHKRFYAAWVIYTAKHANPGSNTGSFFAIAMAVLLLAAVLYSFNFVYMHHHLFG